MRRGWALTLCVDGVGPARPLWRVSALDERAVLPRTLLEKRAGGCRSLAREKRFGDRE